MGEWSEKTLEEVSTSITVGHVGPMASQYVTEGIPFLRSQNVRRGRLEFDNLKYIPPAFHEKLAKSSLQANDIVIVRTGEPGAAAVIPHGMPELNCSDLVIARPSRTVDPRFLCYAINETAKQYITAHTVGAVQQHFNVNSARNLRISLPSLSEQVAISSVLGALDDKIAINERIVHSCDSLRSLRLSPYIGAHLPTVRMIALSSVAKFINGRAFTKGATGTGRMVIRIAEMNSGPGASTVYNDIDVPDEHLAGPGDILFAWSGSLALARWFRPEAIINQHIFKVLPADSFPRWLVFELIKSKLDDFKQIAAGKATTMGHIQRHHLDEAVRVPCSEDIASLDRELGPIWDRALVAEQEKLALEELRDTLLPKLMSGELRVKDAEEIVGDVT